MIANTIRRRVELAGYSIALTFEGKVWTYADLWSASGTVAGYLQEKEITADDRVGILSGNRPEWLIWCIAISRLGAVAVFINPAYGTGELEDVLQAAGLSYLICDFDHTNIKELKLDELPKVDIGATHLLKPSRDLVVGHHDDEQSQAPAVIFFSSGSTGQPKGIVHSSRNLVLAAELIADTWGYQQQDRILIAMPMAFIFASLCSWLAGARRGASIVLHRRFNAAAVVEDIRAGNISLMLGVPSMFRDISEVAGSSAGDGLRMGLTGGDLVPETLIDQFRQRFGAPLLSLYGLTEVPHCISHNCSDQRGRALSCGRVLRDVECKIVDLSGQEVPNGENGEILLRTPYSLLGYMQGGQILSATDADGWFPSGDIGWRDVDGFVYVVDRKKELIKRNGFNILPKEVEAVLSIDPQVAVCAVVGVPDERVGEKVVAFVVPRRSSDLNTEALINLCSHKLAKYKIPSSFYKVDELPTGATGKVDRSALRSLGQQLEGASQKQPATLKQSLKSREIT